MKHWVLAVIAGLLVLGSCDDAQQYAVRMRNIGSSEVENARVSYGQFVFAAGILISAGDHEQIDVREPLPHTAVVEWTDSFGVRHRQVVNISFPQGFKGVLVFEIDGANRARALTEPASPRIDP